jgi:branched-chain amino acid aminotransferase
LIKEFVMLTESKVIWMDGKLIPWKDATVHVLTHSLHYGLAVFEGIRCYEGATGSMIFRLREHVERLFASAHASCIEIPFTPKDIEQAICTTVRENGLRSCYIRPIVFLGYGEMGLYVTSNPVRVAIAAWPWGTYLGEEGLTRGIRVKISSFARHHVNVSLTRAKVSGYYVNSQFAKREVKKAGYDEALLLDTEGYVAEGPGENVFAVRRGILKTPPLTSVLEGITRDTILALAQELRIPVREDRLTRDDLYMADEAFFTGTAAEVTPIREIDDRRIGSGQPGPITKRLQDTFFSVVRGNGGHQDWLTPA